MTSITSLCSLWQRSLHIFPSSSVSSLKTTAAIVGSSAVRQPTTSTSPVFLGSRRYTATASTGNDNGSRSSSTEKTLLQPPSDSSNTPSESANASTSSRPVRTRQQQTSPLPQRQQQSPRNTNSLFSQPELYVSHILHIQATSNNTHVTLTNAQGNTLVWATPGTCGLKKAHRSSPDAGYQAMMQVYEKSVAKNIIPPGLHVKLKGFGPGRDQAFKAVVSTGWNIVKITDCTPIVFNGCRPPKRRKL